jgi:hypothetical protein
VCTNQPSFHFFTSLGGMLTGDSYLGVNLAPNSPSIHYTASFRTWRAQLQPSSLRSRGLKMKRWNCSTIRGRRWKT